MIKILNGDCRDVLKTLPDCSVHCCVTSPPYFGLRDYGCVGQIGLESTPDAYVAELVAVFREVKRVLRDDGTMWLNLGDSYARAGGWSNNSGLDGVSRSEGRRAKSNMTGESGASQRLPTGLKSKDLIGIPWRVAFALQSDGWYLRQDIIWHKPNPMPESVKDRCTKAHEYVFLLSKSERYFFDSEAIKEPAAEPGRKRGDAIGHTQRKLAGRPIDRKAEQAETRNRRSVWTITPKPYRGAHFAVMPPDLAELCILAGTSKRGCCPACGKPWERVVERSAATPGQKPGYTFNCTKRHDGDRAGSWTDHTTATLGWQPGCKCSAGLPVPCTVLDPFGGSGTTGEVAASEGRKAILIELNPEYVKLAKNRGGLFYTSNDKGED